MDIGGLSAASVVWPVPTTARSATTDTATGSAGNDGSAIADRARQAEVRQADATAHTSRPIDPDLPTGPPPAFSTTPLELEGDWQVILARLSAAGYAQVQAMTAPPHGKPSAGAQIAGLQAVDAQTADQRVALPTLSGAETAIPIRASAAPQAPVARPTAPVEPDAP